MQKFNLTTKNNNGAEVLLMDQTQFDIMITLTNDIKHKMITSPDQIKTIECATTRTDKTLDFLKLLKVVLVKGTFKDELLLKIDYLEGSV